MSEAREIRGTVFGGASAVLLGRLTRADGTVLTASDVASISYGVEARDPCRIEAGAAVEGHTQVALDAAEVVYATLQTGNPWDVDATGYNFRHEIDVGSNPAFPEAGRFYSVRYELTPTSGQPIVFRFLIEAI